MPVFDSAKIQSVVVLQAKGKWRSYRQRKDLASTCKSEFKA
ncbi:hypothetical protein THF1C08_30379 [Vibrio jasicida]|nr:hypothetical protein THF1C08_30379 [Vibrio jasicida]